MFNKSCKTDVESLITPEEMTITQFRSGLPAKFEYSEKSVTLTFISVFPHAVVQPNGDIRYHSLHVIPQRCQMDKSHENTFGKIYEEVFTVAQFWGVGFYHAAVENFPRIAPYVDFLINHPSIYIHVASPNSFTQSFMAKLGISPDRLISGIIEALILYLPAGSPCGKGALFNTQMLSAHLRATRNKHTKSSWAHYTPDKSDKNSHKTPSASESHARLHNYRRTVILQERSDKRWFVNHDAIAGALKEEVELYGLKLEIFSDRHLPSLDETIAMFDRAVLVVAPHGAGEANMLFARPGTMLIEVLCKPLNLCYRNLMQNLGHRYYGITHLEGDCFTIGPEHMLPAVKSFLGLLNDASNLTGGTST